MTHQDTNRTEQMQRLELIGVVASGVAHDLNNQFTLILNHLDFALQQVAAHHPSRSNLKDVRRAAVRCTEMVGSLLDFSSPAETRLHRMNLGMVLAETARLLRRVIPDTIDLTFSIDPDLCEVIADGTQIQQVLVNLCINARDAMPHGGRLEITAQNVGASVVITVGDTGCGMSAEIQRRIFEPFFTTKTGMGGMGLGLAMVASIVEKHGGTLTVHSEPGKGTCFEITLSCGPEETVADVAGAAQKTPRKSAGCVLVADDDELVRMVAQKALASKGYRTIEARDGEEAVQQFVAHADEIDLLFLDVTMPRATGLEALTRVRMVKPDVKALLTSGYGATVSGSFLPKPYTAESLTRKVREILAG